jgi:hypothetical protein
MIFPAQDTRKRITIKCYTKYALYPSHFYSASFLSMRPAGAQLCVIQSPEPHQSPKAMLELIAIALLQIASLTAPETTPTGNETTTDIPPVVLTPAPGEQGHGGWGGGII